MIARAVAIRRRGTGEIQGSESLARQWRAYELHDAWGRVFFFPSNLGNQRSDVYFRIVEQHERGADIVGWNGGQVALHVDHEFDLALGIEGFHGLVGSRRIILSQRLPKAIHVGIG